MLIGSVVSRNAGRQIEEHGRFDRGRREGQQALAELSRQD